MYELKPDYAGRLLECPSCGRHLRAGGGRALAPPTAPGADHAFERDVFLLRQRALSIRSKYEVWSEDGQPVLYVERPTYPIRTGLAYAVAAVVALLWPALLVGLVPGLGTPARGDVGALVVLLIYATLPAVFVVVSMSARPRRHVTVYRDESRREVVLRVLQDQRVAVLTRTYTVVSAGGISLARLRKAYLHNIVRKRWYVDEDGRPGAVMAIEDSVILSLLRRVLGSFFGILRTNFIVVRGEDVLGEFNRKLTVLDRYVLDLSGDPKRTFDRRVALALGVMLDSGERR